MYKKGFTLIELLVVISIISLLSSIVLSALSSARDKARIAAGLMFASQISNVEGDQAVGIWNFSEGSGTTVYDSSGNGNTGSFAASAPTWSTDTPSGTGYSLSFNGSSNCITIPDSASMDFSGDLTVAAWVKPTTVTGSWRTIMAKRGGSGSNYELYFNISTGLFGYYNGTLNESTFSPPLNKWTFMTAVINGTTISLYQNGQIISTATVTPVVAYAGNQFYIGCQNGSEFYSGLLDTVMVFHKSLTGEAVQKLYAEKSAQVKQVATAE